MDGEKKAGQVSEAVDMVVPIMPPAWWVLPSSTDGTGRAEQQKSKTSEAAPETSLRPIQFP